MTHRPLCAAWALALLTTCTGSSEPTEERADLRATTSTTAAFASDAGFIAFGDFGGGPAQGAVADAMTAWADDHRVDALVTTGDNVYDVGDPSLFDDHLDRPYADLRTTRPLWVSLGNHDVQSGHGDEQLAYLDLPPLPYVKQLEGVDLFFLDANRPDAEQAAWLRERLAESEATFQVALFHQPAYSCATHGSTPAVVELWVPVFEEAGVDLVLNGHDHLYEHFESPSGVHYVVTGGGGRNLYPFREPCPHQSMLRDYAEEHHFTAVEVTGDAMTVTAVSAEAAVLERFSARPRDGGGPS